MEHSAKHLIVCIALAAVALSGPGCGESGSPPPASDAREPADAADAAGATTVTLAIEGMHCQGCVTAITAKVRTLDGVHEVNVSLEDKAASVTLDRPDRVENILQAIGSLGYEAAVATGPPATVTAPARAD
jgi:copper chaperone CopZ